jgi:hypothetical protein
MIQRYSVIGNVLQSNGGDYVSHEDYARRVQDLEELLANACGYLQNVVAGKMTSVDALAALQVAIRMSQGY